MLFQVYQGVWDCLSSLPKPLISIPSLSSIFQTQLFYRQRMVGITCMLLKESRLNLNTRIFSWLVPKTWFTGSACQMPCPKNRPGPSTHGISGHPMWFITTAFTICITPQNQTKALGCAWQWPQPNSPAVPSPIKGSRLNVVQVLLTSIPLHSMTLKVERAISIGVQTRLPSVFRNFPQIG